MDDLIALSAEDLAAGIRHGRFSSRAVVDAHIRRSEQVQAGINAIVVDRYAAARQQADACDAQLQTRRENDEIDTLPPLWGVPCTIKESLAVAGMPQTAGSIHRRHVISSEDAPVVKRLREAGAIILGVSNTSELCMWMESFNPVYGRSNNAYDRERTAGGSSGGEGAIVGSGASPFGLGSDIGGSIRMPALFNGVFGHKGSPGLVPNDGQYPWPEGIAQEMLATGPLCRRASDLPLLVSLIAADPGLPARVAAVDVKKLRILHLDSDYAPKADRAQSLALQRAVQALQEQGARLQKCSLPGLAQAREIWTHTLSSAGSTSFAEMMYGDRRISSSLRALWQLRQHPSPHTLPLILLSLLERVPEAMPERMRYWLEQGKALRQQLTDLLGDDGVLLDVPYPRQAPLHYRAMLRPFQFVRSAIYNALRLPATACPMGLLDGLPIGVQLIAAPGCDHLGLAVAARLEQAWGGWVDPQSVESWKQSLA